MRCEVCNKTLQIGQWPFCPHDLSNEYSPWIKYVDEHMAPEPFVVDSAYHHDKVMKRLGVELRDPMPRGELSARRDRAVERAKGEGRHV